MGKKKQKEELFWKYWAFRPLPAFIFDESKSGSGLCLSCLCNLATHPPPFEKGGRKLLNCFATAPLFYPALLVFAKKKCFCKLHVLHKLHRAEIRS